MGIHINAFLLKRKPCPDNFYPNIFAIVISPMDFGGKPIFAMENNALTSQRENKSIKCGSARGLSYHITAGNRGELTGYHVIVYMPCGII